MTSPALQDASQKYYSGTMHHQGWIECLPEVLAMLLVWEELLILLTCPVAWLEILSLQVVAGYLVTRSC